jgi:prepilin-type N-terminal cleavage/methylation domain-containing protein
MTTRRSSLGAKIGTSAKAGFTLVEIMIVVGIIGLLAAIAIPNFLRASMRSKANACINNLRQIDAAVQQWALESGAAATANVNSANIAPYLGRGAAGKMINVDLRCPSGGTYTITDVSTLPSCDQPNHAL